ncbi:cysteine--tRNA ligase [Candidatus Saccharibacteria bacterium]|nr:cysteine--tRNA ligase [Candidatus Saccharibacteria bacterium]
MKLYNTLTRKLEEFKPIQPGTVTIYTCGPTVYNAPHIGNLAAYAYWDLLVRYFAMQGLNVKRVLNLTDVGHLVSDGDEGEDKMEKGAAREGKTVYEIADYYSQIYLDNYHKMNFLEPYATARATDFIEADKKVVDEMTRRGFTYETEDGIYFDTSKFPGYADFARLDLAGIKAGARVEFSHEKRNAADFAVWKFIKPGEKHAMRWDYLGRPGYPGWHLECSTIIHELLGEPIDIHTGGVDHIPVHHTNEIAETYAATGKELARYWLHCSFITIDGEKISKSLGNTYTLEDLEARGFSAMDYKMWILSGHYQGTRNFTFESLEAAKNHRQNWRKRIAKCLQDERAVKNDAILQAAANNDAADGAYEISVDNDLVFPDIMAAAKENLNSVEAFKIIDNRELTLADWQKVDQLFGLNLMADTPDISEKTYALLSRRKEAKMAKNYAESDQIRDELAAQNIGINDTKDGQYWYYL